MTDEATNAQAKTSQSQPNPALKSLEVLVGKWEMELSNASFLPRATDTVKGSVSFAWATGQRVHPLPCGSSAGMNRLQSTPCSTMTHGVFRASMG
jgi:hypothetical protein